MNYPNEIQSSEYAIMIAHKKTKPMYQVVKTLIMNNGGILILDDDNNEWVIKPLTKSIEDIQILSKVLNIVKEWKEVVFFKNGEICSTIPHSMERVEECILNRDTGDTKTYCEVIHETSVTEFEPDCIEKRVKMKLPCNCNYFLISDDRHITESIIINQYKKDVLEYGCEICPYFNLETLEVQIINE